MVSVGDLGRATIAFTTRVVEERVSVKPWRQMPEMNYTLSGCKLDGLGLIRGRSPDEPVGTLSCGAPPIDVHRGLEVMDGITCVFLVHNILRGFVYAKSTTSEISEDGYKISKLRCGGPVADDGTRHLGGLEIRLRVKAMMC